jgi:signal transduction histidine kinase
VHPEDPSDQEIIASVSDDLPVGIWVARAPGGEFVWANPTFAEIMGMPARSDVAVGGYSEPYGIFDRAGKPYDEQRLPFVRALGERSTVVVDDLVIHRGDGRRVNVRAHARPVFRGDRITHVVIAFFDISREVAAQRERDDFISAASHELKTPIGALQLKAQSVLLRLDQGVTVGGGEVLEWAQQVERQARRLARLSETLLDVSRIRAGRIVLERQPVDLAELVRQVGARLADDLGGACQEIVIDAPERLPGEGDPVRLDQVLTNLLGNAAKYGRGKPIEVTLRGDGRRARCAVRDHGLGIAPADQARVLEPFTRAVSPASYGGLGLGLWIVREIVARMAGTLEVESAPDRGTTVTVEIPWGEPGA